MTQELSSSRRPVASLWAICLPLLVGAGIAGTAHAQYRDNDRYAEDRYGNSNTTIRCESVKNRNKECRLDGRARLVRQLSGAACVEGRSWGQSRGGVWVSNGCRAEFVGERGRPSRPGHGGGKDKTPKTPDLSQVTGTVNDAVTGLVAGVVAGLNDVITGLTGQTPQGPTHP